HFKLFVEFHILQKIPDRFSTHLCGESVAVLVVVFTILTLCQQLFRLKSGGTGLDYHVGGKINDLFKGTRWHVQQQPHAGRDASAIPYVGNRGSKFNMPHSLTAYFATGHFDPAAVTVPAFVPYSFIFAAA